MKTGVLFFQCVLHSSLAVFFLLCLVLKHTCVEGGGHVSCSAWGLRGRTHVEVPFYDPAAVTLQDCSEEKDLIYSVKATCQPLQVANKRRLYSPPQPVPRLQWNRWSGCTQRKCVLEEKERILPIKRIKMENEKGSGKARVKRETFIVRVAQRVSPRRCNFVSAFKSNLWGSVCAYYTVTQHEGFSSCSLAPFVRIM